MYDIIYQYNPYKYAIVNHAKKTVFLTDIDDKSLNIMLCDCQYIVDLINEKNYKLILYDMAIFYDERGYFVTENELYQEYTALKNNSETDCNTFMEYLKNCTDKNGTLKEI